MTGAATKFSRLLSLDVFRGLTIALMILVNSAGNKTSYAWLEHSLWNGCTIADVVFPFFVFIVGVSSVFSIAKSKEKGFTSVQLFSKILRRSLIIFLIGLCLNAFPYHGLDSLRIHGVLQRIAICYFSASLLFLFTDLRTQFIILLMLLIGYWLALTQIPVPGVNLNHLTAENNLAAYVDRLLLGSNHLWAKTWDPEGILSTLPAIATALIGNLTGAWLLSAHDPLKKLKVLWVAAIISMMIGWLWGLEFPVNKILWTSSYVLWTAGLALFILGGCYWLIDIKGWRKWCKPFEIFGVNALAVFVLHVVFLKIQAMIPMPSGNLRTFITQELFGWASLKNASLFYALTYTLLWFFVLCFFYRKKIFIKI
ncbi:Putative heparan-alpha-glucosaminide N-acetyltransferase [Legionella lansingensis]|uniref:Putative Heparan-alpha-glucosaminide N-acetyltransferase n=1 Tax=Legionella lansingensis TaxID=45067 RepID=A0A0W0VTV2_9GAMM|nr:hypothetical protein [Legionella lansingensis]KTD23470.1 putative Heparan-alpha-glucosaminide N-acetyltransferase [Legionella lansingensis]SNV50809.1 Putative heparan-alpha-glucosaminide N-acetyltransferase [Legionella lansingensis]